MWEAINSFLTKVDDFVWGPPLMILIIAGGILLTIVWVCCRSVNCRLP